MKRDTKSYIARTVVSMGQQRGKKMDLRQEVAEVVDIMRGRGALVESGSTRRGHKKTEYLIKLRGHKQAHVIEVEDAELTVDPDKTTQEATAGILLRVLRLRGAII